MMPHVTAVENIVDPMSGEILGYRSRCTCEWESTLYGVNSAMPRNEAFHCARTAAWLHRTGQLLAREESW